MWPLPAAAQAEAGYLELGAGADEALLRLVGPAGGAPGASRILREAVKRYQDILQGALLNGLPSIGRLCLVVAMAGDFGRDAVVWEKVFTTWPEGAGAFPVTW